MLHSVSLYYASLTTLFKWLQAAIAINTGYNKTE